MVKLYIKRHINELAELGLNNFTCPITIAVKFVDNLREISGKRVSSLFEHESLNYKFYKVSKIYLGEFTIDEIEEALAETIKMCKRLYGLRYHLEVRE